jgi:hypothetical protein
MFGFTIREARREDCKEIRRLIQASLLSFLFRTLFCGTKVLFFIRIFYFNEDVLYNRIDISVWCINILPSVFSNLVTTESAHSLFRHS